MTQSTLHDASHMNLTAAQDAASVPPEEFVRHVPAGQGVQAVAAVPEK
jgi:hypothetical protein